MLCIPREVEYEIDEACPGCLDGTHLTEQDSRSKPTRPKVSLRQKTPWKDMPNTYWSGGPRQIHVPPQDLQARWQRWVGDQK